MKLCLRWQESGQQQGTKSANKVAETLLTSMQQYRLHLRNQRIRKESQRKIITPHAARCAIGLPARTNFERRFLRRSGNSGFAQLLLLRLLSDRTLLIALPPNRKIMVAAKARQAELNQAVMALGYSGLGFTRYPDEDDRERLREEYPDFYEQMFGTMRNNRNET